MSASCRLTCSDTKFFCATCAAEERSPSRCSRYRQYPRTQALSQCEGGRALSGTHQLALERMELVVLKVLAQPVQPPL